MQKGIEISFANGLSGDPAVLCTLKNHPVRFLFDLGDLRGLTKRDLVRTTHAFVSHTHVDHFIGFHQLLRVQIPHYPRLFLAGPSGFIDHVSAAMRSYTWNLIEKGQIRLTVAEIHRDGTVWQAILSNDSNDSHEGESHNSLDFVPRNYQRLTMTPHQVCTLPCGGTIFGYALDHGTPSIGYRYVGAHRSVVDPAAIQDIGIKPGAWIKDLQSSHQQDSLSDAIDVDGTSYNRQKLAKAILTTQEPLTIAYLTDLCFNTENLGIISKHFVPSRLLICESSFLDRDRQRAIAKKHLSTKQAALLGALVEAERLRIFHISNIYGGNCEDSVSEAECYFQTFRAMPKNLLDGHLQAESIPTQR